MRPPPRLSNVYTPVVLPETAAAAAAAAAGQASGRRKEKILAQRSSRRPPHELRRLRMESGLIASAAGSALVQLGNTQVLCTVTGPVTAASPHVPNHLPLNMDEGVLHVDVKYLPATGFPESAIQAESVTPIDPAEQQQFRGLYSWMVNRETDLSARVLSALEAAVPLRPYPKCAICVQITVLQDDGSIVPVCVTAAVAALTQATIELYDLVTACTVAVVATTKDDCCWC